MGYIMKGKEICWKAAMPEWKQKWTLPRLAWPEKAAAWYPIMVHPLPVSDHGPSAAGIRSWSICCQCGMKCGIEW